MKETILLQYIKRIEPFLFLVVSLYFASTLFDFAYYVTSDGSSHIYNADLIGDLLFNKQNVISTYYELNTIIVPNWMGHALLYLFDLFLPSNLAEKYFLGCYFIGFLYSLRYMIKGFNENNGFYALFFLPFILNLFLYSGFYNFVISFVFLFIAIGYFKRHWNNLKLKNGMVLALILILLYLSHLLILAFGIALLFLLLIWFVLIDKTINTPKFKFFIKSASTLFLVALPVFILSFIYLSSHGETRVLLYASSAELWAMIVEVKPFMGHGALENIYSQFYFLLLGILVLFGLIYRIRESSSTFRFRFEDGFLVMAVILLLLFFTLPDSDGKGAVISARILYLFLLMLVFRIALIKLPHAIMVIFVLLIAINTNSHQKLRLQGQSYLNDCALDIEKAGKFVDQESTILPISCTPHWMSQNLFNYLAPDKSVTFLMNYEASQPFFPVCWKAHVPIQYAFSIRAENSCKTHLSLLEHFAQLPDYLFFFGEDYSAVSCWPNSFGESHFDLIYESSYCRLYESKNHIVQKV